MNCELSPELQLGLSKLCIELQLFLNKTQSSLLLAQEKFQQVEYVLKPWEIQDNCDLRQDKCICKTLSNIHISENNEELDLLDTISKTLTNAEIIRKKSLKPNHSSATNSNIKFVQKPTGSKPKITQSVKRCSSVQSSSTNNDKHSPCCPLFNTNQELTTKNSVLILPDAITCYKIPSVLTQTIRHGKKIISSEKSGNSKSCKDIFFQNLEAQNDKYCLLCQEKDSSIETFLTYLSALNSYEKKRKNVDYDSWIFYKDIECLETFHVFRFNLITKESWILILNYISNQFIPVLQQSVLDRKQKLYLFKILKTICNFVYSNVPSVPIFRVQIKTTDN